MLRRISRLVPLVLLAGSATMLAFINVSGTTNNSFVNKFYFSETDDYRWTMYNLCQVTDSGYNCTKVEAAYPFSPSDNFDTDVPDAFVKHRDTYYYLSRIGYAMLVLALFFTLLSLVPVLFTCCLAGFLSGFFASAVVMCALVFSALGATFKTASHVMGVNVFKDAGYSSKLGIDMFVCMWLAVASLLVTYVWMLCVGVDGAERHFQPSRSDSESYSSFEK